MATKKRTVKKKVTVRRDGKVPKTVLEYREKRGRGGIMKPSTFRGIVKKAERAGARNPEAVAGKAYWTTAKAKAKKAKKRKS